MAKKILVVDDERKITELVRAYLQQAGFEVLTAYDGRQALEIFELAQPALVVLDLMLPELDGLDVVRAIRKNASTPIIMLTARTETIDRVTGLEVGADDYVPKPFDPRELVARVRAVLRRSEEQFASSTQRIELGQLVIDPQRHEVHLKGQLLTLTPTEFALLALLAGHSGQAFNRLQIMEALRGTTYAIYDRAIDTHIKNLRRKIEADPTDPQYILTVRGLGYKFREP